jgi:hypothetical protein
VLLQNIHAMSVSNKNQRVKIIEQPRISEILASSTNPSETEETMSATQTTPVVLEPAAQDFADATANPPYLFDLGPDKGRETVDEAQSAEIDRPDVEIEGRSVAGGPGGDVSVRTMRPNLTDGDLPVILYTHDAGWVFGNAHTHDEQTSSPRRCAPPSNSSPDRAPARACRFGASKTRSGSRGRRRRGPRDGCRFVNAAV